MPRKLPWQTSTSTTLARPKKITTATKLPPKRSRLGNSTLESETGTPSSVKKFKSSRGRTPSTSPPPEPPPEEFMKEGLENDDKFRMVEDEFLTVAQQFTVHLHAAEYKRVSKLVRVRNAEAINSISRPVAGKMPDQTKRKVEGVNRSKTQKAVLEGLLGKKAEEVSDDSDAEGLPYVGTTLHGLMDSPRRKAASLLKAGSIIPTTRAAAGFKKPTTQQNSTSTLPSSPTSKGAKSPLMKLERLEPEQLDSLTESDEEDDDLDAPIPAPKLVPMEKKLMPKDNLLPFSRPLSSKPKNLPTLKETPLLETRSVKQEIREEKPIFSAASLDPKARNAPTNDKTRLSRVEFARQQRAKQELEKKRTRKLEAIPSFL
ncbi:hypothetical protein G7Y89_g352 [Cudoniella acicularis]|uniref:Uncharacterized protein n=1 Tax=Cudoniella acicularis TaxID=354080 RepID=A0A8H4WAH8_9HELO|nr:hypothetical protein G7Y89_g352 [Cudoniella acicularis]